MRVWAVERLQLRIPGAQDVDADTGMEPLGYVVEPAAAPSPPTFRWKPEKLPPRNDRSRAKRYRGEPRWYHLRNLFLRNVVGEELPCPEDANGFADVASVMCLCFHSVDVEASCPCQVDADVAPALCRTRCWPCLPDRIDV